MKYLLALFFIFVLNNCGGSKKNHNFKATVIDGYLAESNVSIYDKDDKLLKNIKTKNDASFSFKDTKNDFLYVKATSGIDGMTDEVFNSSLYGIVTKGSSVIISPLGSLVQSYHSFNKDINYKELLRNVEKKLKLTKNILTFDPIANISNEESSKIIKTNITLEFVARLFNTALGGNFEDIIYAYSYVYLNRYESLDFLYSDIFMDAISKELPKRFNYLNRSIVSLKLHALKPSISYIVNELSYFKADNKELLKKSYKASYILTLPIIKEVSLMQNIKAEDTKFVSEYFNDINSKIKSLDMDEILDGLKIMGGFRGVLYRINDINRETKAIKSSYYSNSFLNKELLIKSSSVYRHLSKSIASGAPSQDAFKDELIKNTVFANMENQDIFDSKIVEKIQSQVSLSVLFSKKDAINTNAELLLKEETIKSSKKDFTKYIKPLVSEIKTSKNNAIAVSKINTELINNNNKDSLTFYQKNIYTKTKIQNINIEKQNKIEDLMKSTQSRNIIKSSSELDLIKIKEDLLKEEINKNELAKEVVNYKTKLAVVDSGNTDLKTEIENDLKRYESFTKSAEDKIVSIKNKEASQERTLKSIAIIVQDEKSTKYAKLLERHTESKTKETKEQNIISQIKRAKKVYDNKIKAVNEEKREEEKRYERNLNILSSSLNNGEDANLTLINILQRELRIITSLERKLNSIKVFKSDLAGPIDFTINNLKTCFNSNVNDLFSISTEQNSSFIRVELNITPKNTVFSENALKRKKDDGINTFHIPLGVYDINITMSDTELDVEKTKPVHFEIKEDCLNTLSAAFKAPLQIPNIPIIKTPENPNHGDIPGDIPNPNSGKNPPKIDDGAKPPKDN